MSRTIQVTFDCADPGAQASFWCAALGYEIASPPAGFRAACHDPEGTGPRLFFQKVPEGKTAKNRVHIDLRAAPGLDPDDRMAALEDDCTRLVALGATRVERLEATEMDDGIIVMQDPEGNEFCLG